MQTPNSSEWARFRRLITRTPEGCELYMGTDTTRDGYVRMTAGPGWPRILAHVWSWQAHNGQDVPDGMQVGHLCHDAAVAAGTCTGGAGCRHRRCTNPAHLGIQSPSVNTLLQNHHARNRTECPKGHPYDEGNTIVGSDGKRRCRACQKARRQSSSRS
jgi:hypothetical protein